MLSYAEFIVNQNCKTITSLMWQNHKQNHVIELVMCLWLASEWSDQIRSNTRTVVPILGLSNCTHWCIV